MNEHTIDQQKVCDITQRWARKALRSFPRWELNELHSEAFLVAMNLIQRGRYKPERGALSTFLWHALPMDVRHKYRNANGERYLTDTDGKRRYRQTMFVDDTIASQAQTECPMQMLEPKPTTTNVDEHWLQARLSGMGALELRRRGMNYQEQRKQAEKLYDEQQSKRQTR
tara:strand:+ start:431 stop:940 length:510 start_codon:yes stop_codon:yes gene_type:complete